jgi:hypothetical protein
MNCSVAKKSVKRVCYSLKSHGKTLLEVSGKGKMKKKKHLQETSKRSERTEWGNSREIVKRKGVDVLWRDLVERSA